MCGFSSFLAFFCLLFPILSVSSYTTLRVYEEIYAYVDELERVWKESKNEKTSFFDLAFRARNPQISTEDIQVNLHLDVEPQKTYRLGYPIEKRGMYYLARRLSSQLSLVLKGTDYNLLTKCYSIWICRDDIPIEDQYSISVYEMVNTKNTAFNRIPRENYDLMTLVVIKLGSTVYNGDKEDEGYELFRFLNTIMYPHKDDFMETVSEYIDFSGNDALRKEVIHVSTIEQIKYEGMREELTEELRGEITEELREEGIQALILSNLEEGIPREGILVKIQKYYGLTEENAKQYYNRFVLKREGEELYS